MPESKHYDLVVIGSGPGGYVGAIRAAQLGMKTAVIERNRLGGVCLNWGCIPSKALLHNAELWNEAVTHGDEWGFSFEKASLDFQKAIGRSRGVADKLNAGVGFLLKKNKIDHIEGHARITSGAGNGTPCSIELTTADDDYYHGTGSGMNGTVTADKIIIATGAAPKELPFAPFNGTTIVGSHDAMVLPKQPGKLVVIGSGAIGMEFAYFYNAIGTEVTVVEMLDRILPVEDEDVSKAALKAFRKQGITFHVGSMTTAVETSENGATVTIQDSKDTTKTEQLEADVVLVGIGVGGRFEGLIGDGLDLELEKGHIKTDAHSAEEPTYATSVPGIHAIGDVIGPPMARPRRFRRSRYLRRTHGWTRYARSGLRLHSRLHLYEPTGRLHRDDRTCSQGSWSRVHRRHVPTECTGQGHRSRPDGRVCQDHRLETVW